MSNKSDYKTCVFFIDGASWDLLNPWVDSGALPNFAKIKHGGAYGNLESVIPTETSFATGAFTFGKNPARIGIFKFSDLDKIFVTADKFPGKQLWEYLSIANYRSLVLDMPSTWPPRPIYGVLFTGFYTPLDAKNFVYPESLAKNFTNYPIGGIEIIEYLKKDINTLPRAEFDITGKRWRVFCDLLDKEDFDFACFYVKGSDILQHYFWHDRDLLFKFYSLLDGFIGELLESKKFSNIFIISDHGFAASPSTSFFINTFLKERGYLKIKGWKANSLGQGMKSFLENHRRLARFVYQLFGRLRTTILKKKEKLSIQTREVGEIMGEDARHAWVSSLIDEQESLVYAKGGTLRGKGLYINRQRTTDEHTYRQIIDKLMGDLGGIMYENKPIVQYIATGKEAYGDLPDIPDIVFLPHHEFFVDDRFSTKVFGPRKTKSRAHGHHLSSLHGIFMGYGPKIKPGRYEHLHLIDIFPTILSMYEIPLPPDIDGRPMKNIFQDNLEVKKQTAQVNTDRELEIIIDSIDI